MKTSARLAGIDATRGIALLGMMAVHSLYESTSDGKASWTFAVFGGRAAATFAVLAGVGIAFTTGRKRVPAALAGSTAAGLAARALAVGAIGLALGYADAALGAVILPYYAVLFLLAIPLVFLPTKVIAVLGVLVAFGMPALSHLLIPHLPVANLSNPTVGYLIRHPIGLFTELSITGEYPALPWLAYLCAGLVIGRLTLSKIRVALALTATGLTLAVGAAMASSVLLNRMGGLTQIWLAQPGSRLTVVETGELLELGGDGTAPADTWWWLAVDAPHTSTPPDLLGTIGSATGLLGLMLLAGHLDWRAVRHVVKVAQVPLAAAGSMTLSLYTAHIMFINSDYDQYTATTGYILQAVAVLLLALAWRATAGRGPLEALVTAVANRARRLVGKPARPRRADQPAPRPRPSPVPRAVRPSPVPRHGPPPVVPCPRRPWPPSPVPREGGAARERVAR